MEAPEEDRGSGACRQAPLPWDYSTHSAPRRRFRAAELVSAGPPRRRARWMAVAQSMGPERVCPEEPGPPEAPDGATGWSGDEEEEEDEEGEGGGYLYQPLSQEPEQGPSETDHSAAPADSAETGPGLQERLQVPLGVSHRHGDLGRGSGAAARFRGPDSRCSLYSADA